MAADQYIDTSYIKARLGGGYITAVAAVNSISLDAISQSATGLVQSWLRKRGYDVPAVTTTDETTKLAVLGCVMLLIAQIPEAKIALPDNWQEHPARLAILSVKSEDGDGELTISIKTIAATGGYGMTESRSGFSDAKPPRASRGNLSGY